MILGGFTEFRKVNDDERILLNHVKNNFKEITSGLKDLNSDHVELLKQAGDNDVRVKTQVVAGRMLLFEISTGNPTDSKLYLKVFQGLPANPVVEVKYIGTDPKARTLI
ncbi:hypothetical protein RF11_15679 [Thelohanellus kitauei]|uniref:Uncharacterized protein n=1 Tax=Thelohanellus kitauei TaxID=669202 RepID=A0A0C2IX32_THEKT|nr:hypothetical protein RF11_15679 [Thelohanellus kitauei]